MLEKGSTVFGNWIIEEKIGSGAFGTVYKIKKEEFGRTYFAAMKVLKIPQDNSEYKKLRSEGMDDESISTYYGQIVEDFIKEIELLSSLDGITNIVDYKDHIIEPSADLGYTIYIKMQLLIPLSNRLVNENGQATFMSQSEVLNLGMDICSALEICEKHNIIHRDIKVDNIFVSANGDYKLGDFGLAKQLEATQGEMSKKGTLMYMAPEVFRGDKYNKTADIYSLGIVLYRLLNKNRAPFFPEYPAPIKFTDKEQANAKRLNGEALPAINGVSDAFMDVLRKACAFDPKDRYSNASEFKKALESVKKEITEPVNDDVTCAPLVCDAPIENIIEDDLEATASAFNDEIPQIAVESQNIEAPDFAEDDLEATASAFNDDVPQVDIATQNNDLPEVVVENETVSEESESIDITGKDKESIRIFLGSFFAILVVILGVGFLMQKNLSVRSETDFGATSEATVNDIVDDENIVNEEADNNTDAVIENGAENTDGVIDQNEAVQNYPKETNADKEDEQVAPTIYFDDIKGATLQDAEAMLNEACVFYEITCVYSSSYPCDTIVGEARGGWTDGAAYIGDTVELLLSCGPASDSWIFGEPDYGMDIVTETVYNFWQGDKNVGPNLTYDEVNAVFGSDMCELIDDHDISAGSFDVLEWEGSDIEVWCDAVWRPDYEIWD